MANLFRQLWDMGYQRLVPVVPPGAPVSERSSIYKRLQANVDARGKVPGVMNGDGKWHSFDWTKHETTEDDLERWHAMGASGGIKTGPQADGTWLIGIDADTLDDRCAALISGEVRKTFGQAPMRIGRAPKALYVIRIDGPLPYTRVDFGLRSAKGVAERVELLSGGRQFIAFGLHPTTMQPYRWAEKLPPYDDLPVWPAGVFS